MIFLTASYLLGLFGGLFFSSVLRLVWAAFFVIALVFLQIFFFEKRSLKKYLFFGLGGLLFFLVGMLNATRIHLGVPVVLPERSSRSFVTNLTVKISSFPVMIPPVSDENVFRVRAGDVTLISPLLSESYPGQTLSVRGRLYQRNIRGKMFASLYLENSSLDPLLPDFLHISTKDQWRPPPVLRIVSEGAVNLSFVSRLRKGAALLILKESNPNIRALMMSLILGNRTFLNAFTVESFRRSGVAHLIALSGLHVGLLSFLLVALFSLFLPKRLAYLPASLAILFYVFFAGMAASLLRAGLIFVTYNTLRSFGKRPDWLEILAFTALILLLFNPSFLFDVGFLLSYTATAGIVLFAPRLIDFFKVYMPTFVAEVLAVSLTATLSTAPIILQIFGYLNLLSLLANLIIVPLFSIFIMLIFADFLFILLSLPYHLFEQITLIFWRLITALSRFFSLSPVVVRKSSVPSVFIPLSFAVLLLFFLCFSRFRLSRSLYSDLRN